MSNLMNKVKEVVPGLHPDPSTTTTSTTTSTTNTPGSANVGPHRYGSMTILENVER